MAKEMKPMTSDAQTRVSGGAPMSVGDSVDITRVDD